MKPRTLLLATYHFPPSAASGSFRLLGFARHLLAHGWRTVVVAPPLMPFEPVDEKLARQVPRETVVYPVPYPQGDPLSNRLIRRFAPYGVWLPAAYQACARAIAEHRPDAVLTSSPPHTIHLLGRLLKSRYGLPWVADYRDPWLYGLGKPLPTTWCGRWEALKEKSILKAADGIVTNTPLARAALANDLPEYAAKMTYITNGFDPESFAANEPAPRQASQLTILHTGELYAGRDPRPLFDALTTLDPTTKAALRLAFLGQSSDPRYDWPGEVRERGLDGMVSFAGHAQYGEALRQMQAADILLLLDHPGRRVGIPAKLFEYFGARRPILALSDPQGDVGWALRQSGVQYRIAMPNEPGLIRQAVTELVREIGATSAEPQPIPEEFTRAHMAAQLARFLEKVSRRRASVG